MPANYFDEQYVCITQSLVSAPEKIRNNLPVVANCHPSDTTRQQCASTDGSFCPYLYNIVISFPGFKEDFRSTVELCIPNGCTVDDLKEVEKYWTSKYNSILQCNSPDACATAQFSLQCPALINAQQSHSNGPNGWAIFLAVVILLLVAIIAGTAFYVYKKKQANPDVPITVILDEMPPMRITKEAFISAREGLSNRWTQLSQEDTTYG